MSEHMQQFTQQLASWSHSIIELARLPFRRVETYPKISTDTGTIQPPLVFWINRQSLMAGGILLIPEKDVSQELDLGKACCEALGLKHFVTWEANQVRIWEVTGEQIREERCLKLQAPDQPDTFRYLLEDVLNALKLLAILGAVPPRQLAPQYYNNLFQITLEQTAPSLIEVFRKLRSEHGNFKTVDLDQQAHEANRLFLLKILALLLFDKHPDPTQPEKLEQTINESLEYLPSELSSVLLRSNVSAAPQLPFEAAVGFHHLLMRLQQLNWVGDSSKAVQSLDKLMLSWYGAEKMCTTSSICIYPEAPQHANFSRCIISDQLPILAATGLFARAAQQSLPQLVLGPVYNYTESQTTTGILTARLLNQRSLMGQERQEIAIGLRKAWPSRRFPIRAGQPYWLWECIYLMGIATQQTLLHLEIPITALQSKREDVFWQILTEYFAITQIEKKGTDTVLLQLAKTAEVSEPFNIIIQGENRVIEGYEESATIREQILLALFLPNDIFKLIGKELIWHSEATESYTDKSLQLFAQSTLFQLFKTLLTAPGKKAQKPQLNHIPIPDEHYGKELVLQAKGRKATDIDQILADLFKCPQLTDITMPRQISQTSQQTTTLNVSEDTEQHIREQLLAHGCPDFPEQYLYFLDHPELEKFLFTPPLQVKANILGQFELEDANGKIIEGYGEELEQALLICSVIGKSKPELPTDRHQLTTLLEYYKKDLNSLYKTLEQECYSQIGNPQAARKQIALIWREQKLPEPGWFR